MDRNRFIQCMKSNIELSDKEITPEELQKAMDVKLQRERNKQR